VQEALGELAGAGGGLADAGPTGTLQQTTRLTDDQRQILAATGVAAPPRITALQPA
jgi:hypothetical protein